jgi:hypothetical protein
MTRAAYKMTRNTAERFGPVSVVSPRTPCILIPQKRNTEACFNPPETRPKHGPRNDRNTAETPSETR